MLLTVHVINSLQEWSLHKLFISSSFLFSKLICVLKKIPSTLKSKSVSNLWARQFPGNFSSPVFLTKGRVVVIIITLPNEQDPTKKEILTLQLSQVILSLQQSILCYPKALRGDSTSSKQVFPVFFRGSGKSQENNLTFPRINNMNMLCTILYPMSLRV